jgi:two-component system LytT family response regulator
LRAFAANAVDYLLKPVEPECLDRALAKVERLRHSGAAGQLEFQRVVRQLADSLRDSLPEYPERIASRLGQRICFLDLTQVTHFYAEDKLNFAVCASKAYCIDQSMVELERTLNPRKFLRIHRSTLVNIAWIEEIASLPGGALNVRLRDSPRTELVVARDRAQELRKRLGY